MAAILLDSQPGDEVILPSFTFVSSANAFILRGAKPVFIDSKKDHPNMDENLLEDLISSKTKAIVVVHYGGLPCTMDRIMDIAQRHGIKVVEDAAQAIDSFYDGKALGGIGHLGCMSFHETKNVQCGEGGMLIINDSELSQRAEIIWEKGTNRAAYFRGELDKYGWVDLGSSFLPSEVTAAFLWAQLETLDTIQNRRKKLWEDYFGWFTNQTSPELLSPNYLHLIQEAAEGMEFSIFSKNQQANAHLFCLVVDSLEDRTMFAGKLKAQGVLSVFHYQSLHRSSFVQAHFPEQVKRSLPNSDHFSDCLIRLPFFLELPEKSFF
jgi:dTDP-4-amino-4,6-dideoxygalactose transaminase